MKVKSINLLVEELRKRKIVTTIRNAKSGRTIGGIPFTRGPLTYLLRNRFYIGQVVYKGEVLPGEQPPIVDKRLFDTVQARLNQQRNNWNAVYTGSEALLLGKIFDEGGSEAKVSITNAKVQSFAQDS